MQVTTLKPVSGNVSFYGKAVVIEYSGIKYLKSYNTVVCAITDDNEFIRFWDDYSATTQKHINSFLLTYGLPSIGKKEWEAIEVSNEPIPLEVIKVPMKYKVADHYAWY